MRTRYATFWRCYFLVKIDHLPRQARDRQKGKLKEGALRRTVRSLTRQVSTPTDSYRGSCNLPQRASMYSASLHNAWLWRDALLQVWASCSDITVVA